MKRPKMLVIGLDGASWNLIGDWVNEGDLPNIRRLKEEGCWGELRSCVPPITCPAWKCYSTGKNPGKLSIFWWEHLDLENKRVITPNSTSFKSKELWDYLNENEFKTGIIGMPTTYPPKKVDGFIISGGPFPGSSGYTYPANLEGYLKEELGYVVHPSSSVSNSTERKRAVKEILCTIDLTFEAAKALSRKRPIDFLQITTFYLNALQHYFYDEEPTKRAWKLIDDRIGELVHEFEYVLLMSDHGVSPMEKNFFINSWLEKEGYLHRKRVPNILLRLSLNRDDLEKIVKIMGLRGFLRKLGLMRRIASIIPNREGMFGYLGPGEATLRMVDWARTRVAALPQGPIYINKDLLKNVEEYEELREGLISKLKRIRDPENNKAVFYKVYRREEIYSGEHVESAPDLIAISSNEYHNKGGIGKLTILEKSDWKGNNAMDGMLIINGPHIKKGRYIKNAEIFDLAPTILHIFNLPIPKDMDGKVLREIFEEESKLAKRKILYKGPAEEKPSERPKEVYTKEEEERIKERLRRLGYLG